MKKLPNETKGYTTIYGDYVLYGYTVFKISEIDTPVCKMISDVHKQEIIKAHSENDASADDFTKLGEEHDGLTILMGAIMAGDARALLRGLELSKDCIINNSTQDRRFLEYTGLVNLVAKCGFLHRLIETTTSDSDYYLRVLVAIYGESDTLHLHPCHHTRRAIALSGRYNDVLKNDPEKMVSDVAKDKASIVYRNEYFKPHISEAKRLTALFTDYVVANPELFKDFA